MGEWLTQWLVDNEFLEVDCANGLDAFEFIENCPARDEIFGKLCIGGLCHSLDNVDENILAKIGYEYARRNLTVPLEKRGQDLFVAICDPCALNAIDEIAARSGLNVICLLAKKDLLLSFFKIQGSSDQISLQRSAIYGKRDNAANRGISDNGQNANPETSSPNNFGASDLQLPVMETLADESAAKGKGDIPLDRLFEYFTELAANMRASDVHFECNSSGMRVRFRVDGKLRTIQQLDQNLAKAAIANVKLRAKLKLDETRLPQDGRLKVRFDTRECDVRVSIIPNIYGENAVLRIFNADSEEFSLNNLGMDDFQISCVKALANLSDGLLLISGPTGSGKTTTIYSLLKYISSPEKKVITVEDPIEYMLPNVSQVSVDEKIGLTFNRILRAVLRQAPNVIFIGEIRDSETAQSAIQAALTGHLVLSTVHAGSSEEAITRLRDLGVSEYLIDSCVRCVISQELMRLKCKFCRGSGHCDKCLGRGYYGRTGVFEILASGDLSMEKSLSAKKSPSKLRNFEFLCTMEGEISRLGEVLCEEDLKLLRASVSGSEA